MGETQVTQAQYEAVKGNNPSDFKGAPTLPVETASWNDAKAFCEKLSQKSNLMVELPTEAQWEYACRVPDLSKLSTDNLAQRSRNQRILARRRGGAEK